MKGEHRDWLEDFVLKAQAAQAAVNKLLQMEDGMGKGNAYHPTGDARADGIKAKVEELIAYVKRETEASGPETKRRAAIAITGLEQVSMWAVKALFSEDAVRGDDGGGKEIPTELAKEISDARDADPPA